MISSNDIAGHGRALAGQPRTIARDLHLGAPVFVRERLAGLARQDERILGGEGPLSAQARRLVAGGKKLRAQLLFSAAPPHLGPRIEERLLAAAGAIELIHAGSLIHDDIVDHCALRRGEPALHVEHGVRAAAWSGAWTMYAGMARFAALPGGPRERFAATAHLVADGQLREIASLGDLSLPVRQRIAIMEAKTASVFALACALGGMLSEASADAVASLACAGGRFGLLFQLADDLEDLLGSEAETGRPAGNDLREGVASLPILFAARTCSREELRATVERARSSDGASHAWIGEWLLRRGALHRTAALAASWGDRASRALMAAKREVGAHCGHEWIATLLARLLSGMATRFEVIHDAN